MRKQKIVTNISTISRGVMSEPWVPRCMFSIHIAIQVWAEAHK